MFILHRVGVTWITSFLHIRHNHMNNKNWMKLIKAKAQFQKLDIEAFHAT